MPKLFPIGWQHGDEYEGEIYLTDGDGKRLDDATSAILIDQAVRMLNEHHFIVGPQLATRATTSETPASATDDLVLIYDGELKNDTKPSDIMTAVMRASPESKFSVIVIGPWIKMWRSFTQKPATTPVPQQCPHVHTRGGRCQHYAGHDGMCMTLEQDLVTPCFFNPPTPTPAATPVPPAPVGSDVATKRC